MYLLLFVFVALGCLSAQMNMCSFFRLKCMVFVFPCFVYSYQAGQSYRKGRRVWADRRGQAAVKTVHGDVVLVDGNQDYPVGMCYLGEPSLRPSETGS